MNKSLAMNICAFIVLLCLLATTVFKKMFKGTTNKIFFIELIVCSFAAFFSIVSSVIILYFPVNLFTIILANIFKYLYFICNSLIVPLVFLYILSSIGILYIFKQQEIFKLVFLIAVLIPLCIIIDNLFSHRLFSITQSLGYTTFFAETIFMIVNFVYITISVIFLFIYRKFLPKSKLIVGFTMYPSYALVMAYHFTHSYVDINVFVYAITCYLVMTTAQRPELLINPSAGVWSDLSFFNECKKGYLLNRPASVILIKIQNYQNLMLYLGQDHYYGIIKSLTAKFSMLLANFKQEENLYYLEDATWGVLMDSVIEEHLSIIAGELNYELSTEFMYKDFRIVLNPCVCVVNVPADISNYDSFNFFAKSFYSILPLEEKVIYIKEFVNSRDFIVRNQIGTILSRAIKEKNFEVFYQPIYGIKEDKFICAEALIRIKDPEYGYILPSVFLKHAEENGMIHSIGDFVFEEVCRFIASPDFDKLGLKYIEINLSQTQCVEENFVPKFLGIMNKYKLSYDKIRLEITESTVTSNPVLIENNIRQLHNEGIRFALDNYGTGYSNIRTVTQLPFSVIKLDKTFVDNIHDKTMWTVVQDTIFMLKQLNKEILVEGIENESAVKIFKELKCDLIQGCEYIQGYYFSKPVPKDEFKKIIKKLNGIEG